ncbi:MAG: hypothetical protein KC435_00345 [Thermomicrobiales bacterium]|nr:hypothetical protein [Thermomicrobiales bacterium]
MAEWLYRITPARPQMVTDPTDTEAKIVGDHFQYLVSLRDAGILILAGRTQEDLGTFGIVIFEAADADTARSIAEADPAVSAGVFDMTLHPYAIAVSRDR